MTWQPMTTERLIATCEDKFEKNTYDYSKAVFTKSMNKIIVICPKHGEFAIDLYTHMKGAGCKKCATEQNASKKKERALANLPELFSRKHKNKYTYNWDTYSCKDKKMEVFCPKHGSFWMSPYCHLERGQGCPKCAGIERGLKRRLGYDEIIRRFIEKHGNKFNYSFVPDDISYNTRIKVKCPHHGLFELTVASHLIGTGCPVCINSHGERDIRAFLEGHNICFYAQYKFPDCKYKRKLPFDFYLPGNNCIIEYQGSQHSRPYDRFGGEKALSQTRIRDKIKKEYCEKHNIKFFEILFTENIEKRMHEILNI